LTLGNLGVILNKEHQVYSQWLGGNTVDQLELLLKLALNSNLSKSEMNVIYFCYYNKRNSKEVAEYLKWASPNVSRLLLAMVNRGLLNRYLDDDSKAYYYTVNKESQLL